MMAMQCTPWGMGMGVGMGKYLGVVVSGRPQTARLSLTHACRVGEQAQHQL